MKNTKRFIAAVMAVTSIMAIAPMSAFADTTEVTFNAPRNSPEFTITIPASVDFTSGTGTATIKAEGVYLNTDKHKQVNVTLDSASNTENGAEFNAKNSAEDSTVTYTISKGEDSISIGDTIATFVTSESETVVQTQDLTFTKTGTPTYAGTHTEVLTFGVSVEDAAAANPYQAIATASVGEVVNFKWNDTDMNWIHSVKIC